MKQFGNTESYPSELPVDVVLVKAMAWVLQDVIGVLDSGAKLDMSRLQIYYVAPGGDPADPLYDSHVVAWKAPYGADSRCVR